MRIALITNFAPRGGAHVLFRREALLLSNAGHDVFLFSDNMRLENGPHMQSHTISPIHERMKPADEQKIIDVLKYINPNIIHLHLATLLDDVGIISDIMKIAPIVITPHSHQFSCPSIKKIFNKSVMPCPDRWSVKCLIRPYTKYCNYRHPIKLLSSFRKYLANRNVAKNAYFAVTCDYMAKSIQRSGISMKRIKILPPIAKIADKKPIRQKDRPALLFVGALNPEKGVHCLFDASSGIKIDHKIMVAGDGWMMDSLKRQSERVLNGKVVFFGWVSEERLADLYSESAMVVIPSLCPETFALSGIEALGHGVPVIAFNVGGISDWLVNGENGLLVSVGDIEGLASAIERLLQNPELADMMGEKGIELVNVKFSQENHLKRLLPIYKEAIESFDR